MTTTSKPLAAPLSDRKAQSLKGIAMRRKNVWGESWGRREKTGRPDTRRRALRCAAARARSAIPGRRVMKRETQSGAWQGVVVGAGESRKGKMLLNKSLRAGGQIALKT